MTIQIVALVLALVGGAPQKKDAAPVTPGPFGAARDLACSFPAFATVQWKADPPNVLNGAQEFSFRITAIDFKKKTARVEGSGGTALVAVLISSTGLSVIEQTPIGNAILTTVFAAGGTTGPDARFLAVHSRHLGDISTAPTVSQSYGACTFAN